MKILEKARLISGVVVTDETRYDAHWNAVALGEKIEKSKSQASSDQSFSVLSKNKETEKSDFNFI